GDPLAAELDAVAGEHEPPAIRRQPGRSLDGRERAERSVDRERAPLAAGRDVDGRDTCLARAVHQIAAVERRAIGGHDAVRQGPKDRAGPGIDDRDERRLAVAGLTNVDRIRRELTGRRRLRARTEVARSRDLSAA